MFKLCSCIVCQTCRQLKQTWTTKVYSGVDVSVDLLFLTDFSQLEIAVLYRSETCHFLLLKSLLTKLVQFVFIGHYLWRRSWSWRFVISVWDAWRNTDSGNTAAAAGIHPETPIIRSVVIWSVPALATQARRYFINKQIKLI